MRIRNYTQEKFKEIVFNKNKHYRNGDFKIIGKFKDFKTPVIIKTKYGYCKISPISLVNNIKPSIQSAIYKHLYFTNLLYEKNKHFYKRNFFIDANTYTHTRSRIKIITKYGECETSALSLLMGSDVGMIAAINKTEFFIKKSNIIHNFKYIYSSARYIDSTTKIKITCPEHGDFLQVPNSHLKGNGCPTCSFSINRFNFSDWNNSCSGNPGIFYVLKCYNENEEFIKIGITCKSIESRYSGKTRMPYKYIILTKIINCDKLQIWNLEKKLKKKLKMNKYNPKIYFAGSKTEIFTIAALNTINDELYLYQ